MLKAFLSLLRQHHKPSLAQQRLEVVLKTNQPTDTTKLQPEGEVPGKPNQYYLDTTRTTVLEFYKEKHPKTCQKPQ